MRSQALILIAAALLIRCDAPRLNPLDAQGSNYLLSETITLLTTKLNVEFPLSGVEVTIPELVYTGLTGADGRLTIPFKPLPALRVYLTKDSYFSDTLTIDLSESLRQFSVPMNARPGFQEYKLISVYDSFFEQTLINLNCRVSDSDGLDDISALVISNPSLNFSDTLRSFNVNTGLAEKIWTLQQISAEINEQQIIEHPFFLELFNKNSDRINIGNIIISRVLDKKLNLVSPAADAEISGEILFRWQPVDFKFNFTYQLDLYRHLGGLQLISSVKNLPPTQDNYQMPALSRGSYYWQVLAIDQLGNICLSDLSGFSHLGM